MFIVGFDGGLGLVHESFVERISHLISGLQGKHMVFHMLI